MNNSNDMMFQYLLQMGAMQPEQQEMKRKQAMIDALRQQSMEGSQGKMVSGHYITPGVGGLIEKLALGYFAGKGQKAQDAAFKKMNADQRDALERLRQQQMMGQQPIQQNMMQTDPYQALRFPDEA